MHVHGTFGALQWIVVANSGTDIRSFDMEP